MRDQIYLAIIDEPHKKILFHEFCHRELPCAIHATEPLLQLDRTGTARQEALTHWLRTRNFILEHGFEHEWEESAKLLASCGINLYAEMRSATIWAWDMPTLLMRVEELKMCTKLNVVEILLGEDMVITAKEAASFFSGFRKSLRVHILREDEFVENEAPACERVFHIS
jgi:hypothetical protein